MIEGHKQVVTRQFLATERQAALARVVILSLLLLVFLVLKADTAGGFSLSHLLAVSVWLSLMGYSLIVLRMIRKDRFPDRFCNLSLFLDALGISVFWGLSIPMPADSGILLSVMSRTAYFVPLVFLIVKLRPSAAVFGGLIFFFSTILVLVFFLFAFPDRVKIPRELYFFPPAILLAAVTVMALSRAAFRLLEKNLATEDLQRASRRLRMTVEIVQASIFNLSQFVSNLEAISNNLAQGAQNQTRSVEHISRTAEQLRAAMNIISGQTDTSARTIQRTVEFSESGNQIVHRVIDEILGIHEVVDQMDTSLDLINEIADQTNLLALNSAIEASKAGKESSGFSVVADEIRRLAERSAETAGEISRLVKQVEQVIFSGGESSKEAGKIFDRINKDLGGYSHFVQELHHAVQQQLGLNQEVNASVENIGLITAVNSQASENVRAVVGELKKEVAKLESLISGKMVESLLSSSTQNGRAGRS